VWLAARPRGAMSGQAGPRLRVLFLTPQLPYPPHQGRSLRNYNLLRYLALDAGHQVSLLSFSSKDSAPEDLEHLRRLGKEHLFVLQIAKGEVHEDEAAIRLAKALVGPGVIFDEQPSEGKIALKSAHRKRVNKTA